LIVGIAKLDLAETSTMLVGVDETRHEDRIGKLLSLCRSVAGGKIRGQSDIHDLVALDGDRTLFYNGDANRRVCSGSNEICLKQAHVQNNWRGSQSAISGHAIRTPVKASMRSTKGVAPRMTSTIEPWPRTPCTT